MASYNTVVQEVLGLLNRTDCTTALAQYWVNDAIRRIERVSRLPCMERKVITTAAGPMDYIMVPADLLKIKRITGPHWDPSRVRMPLQRLDMDQLLEKPRLNAWPRYWAREQNQIWIRGQATEGQAITLEYWGQFSPFVPVSGSTDPGTGSNEITTVAPDLVRYGALAFAGDYFEHPKASDWLNAYNGLLSEVQNLADDMETDAGPTTIQPTYSHGWEE